MKASIKRDGRVVIADVEANVHVAERDGLLEWSGSFEAGHEIGFDDNEYEVDLADGRSGRILIIGQGIAGGSNTKLVRFLGTGRLSPPEED